MRASAEIVAEDEGNCAQLACRFVGGRICGWRDLAGRSAAAAPFRLQPPGALAGEFCPAGAVLRKGQSAGLIFAPLKLGPLPRILQVRICELSPGLRLRVCYRDRRGALRCRLKRGEAMAGAEGPDLAVSVLVPPGAKQLIVHALNEAVHRGAVGLDFLSLLHPPPPGATQDTPPLPVCPYFKK